MSESFITTRAKLHLPRFSKVLIDFPVTRDFKRFCLNSTRGEKIFLSSAIQVGPAQGRAVVAGSEKTAVDLKGDGQII
jgi:hypothetical protein